MKSKHALSLVCAVLLQGGAVSMAEAGGPPRWGGPGCPGHGPGGGPFGRPDVERAVQAGAGAEQVKELSNFLFDQRAKLIDLKAAADKAELALDRLMDDPPGDEEAVVRAIDSLNAARGELFKLELMTRIKIRRILGDEILRKMCPKFSDGGPGRPGCRPPTPGAEPSAGQDHDTNEAALEP